MKKRRTIMIAVASLLLGLSVGLAAKTKLPGASAFVGKPAKEAGLAALAEAEKLDNGSWELIGIGRVYYLAGDKAKGQALFDRVTAKKPEKSDWQRIGHVYAEAGENAKAEECFQKAMDPEDDTGQSEIGAWYVRTGQVARGEELFAKALDRNPDDLWHYVRAAEAYLGVPAGK